MIMSPLTVRITRKGQICTLAVSGELDIATTHVLARRAAEALRLPTERLIIDLSGLQFIDVCGARGLADVTRAAPPGYPVLVRGAAGPVRRILDLLALPLEQSGAVTPDSAERPARTSKCSAPGPRRPASTALKPAPTARTRPPKPVRPTAAGPPHADPSGSPPTGGHHTPGTSHEGHARWGPATAPLPAPASGHKDALHRTIMMPYGWRWSSLQLTGQADFWHPAGRFRSIGQRR